MKAEYFSHDYKARSDDKLVRVMMVHGLAGIGAYWCIIEMLFENDGYIMQSECERIAFELRTNVDFVKSIFNDFGLFKSDKKYFFSESCLERLNKRKEKSAKASASASARWNDANALPSQSKSNANGMLIKEKESKEKESKEKIVDKLSPEVFYQTQIALSNNDIAYKKYVDVLFGNNDAGYILNGILGMEKQITFDQFQKLLAKSKEKNESLIKLTLAFENGKYFKNKKSIYLSLNDWLNKR